MEVVGPFEVKYELGHSYQETWKRTDYFCPNCGTKSIWVEDANGDFYEGPNHLCLTCDAEFTLPVGAVRREKNGWQDQQRLHYIREAIGG